MPAYSFSLKDFEWMIPKGRKWRTTRLLNDGMRYYQACNAMLENRPARLYWKQRTKQCKLLLEAKIESVTEVIFTEGGASISCFEIPLAKHELEEYAYSEGFDSWQEFIEAIEELHGPDFKKNEFYTVEWARPPHAC